MKLRLWFTLPFLTLVACSSANHNNNMASTRTPATDSGPLLDPDNKDDFAKMKDSSSDPMTVWKANRLAETEEGRKVLDTMFSDEGLNLSKLPHGYAVGAGEPFPWLPEFPTKALSNVTDSNWRGKIFCKDADDKSYGYNRIREFVDIGGFREWVNNNALGDFLHEELSGYLIGRHIAPGRNTPIVPMASFKTYLVDHDPFDLAQAKSNMVILNYADPVTDGKHKGDTYPIEKILTLPHIGQVYDVVVAVKGKYGPVYLGKTWLGTYDANTKVFSADRKSLIARFFLDFNPDALLEQKDTKMHPSAWPAGQPEIDLTNLHNCPGVTKPK